MGIPDRFLTEGEEIAIDARPHWVALVWPVTVAVAIAAVASYAIAKIDNGIARWAILGVAALLFLFYPVRWFIKWVTSHFVVTNERVIHLRGLIAKGSMDIPLQRINDVRFDQNIIQRILGAGTLILESAGERGRQVFESVRNPELIQRTISERAEEREMTIGGAGLRAEPPTPSAAPKPSVTEELARLADLRDRGALTAEEFEAQKAKLLGS
ncbi:MAG TPA: PH domain-containing protein [Actinomycetota bacterium]